MSKEKQHLDEFLRNKLNELPNAPVAGFERLEKRMAAKSHRGIVLMLLIPLIFSGIYWVGTFTEKDLIIPSSQEAAPISNSPAGGELVSEPAAIQRTQEENEKPTTQPDEVDATAAQVVVPIIAVVPQKNQTAPASVNKPLAEPGLAQLKTRAPPTIFASQHEEMAIVLSQSDQPQQQQVDMLASAVIAAGQEKTTASQPEDARLPDNLIAPIYAAKTPWEVTLNFYPNYTFREFKVNPNYRDLVDPRYEEIISNSERGGFGYNAGITVRYHLGKDVFISSGLGYIENKVNGTYNFDIYQAIDPDKQDNVARVGKTEEFEMYTAIPVNKGIVQTFRYVQVPMHISYQPWVTNRLRLLVEGGFSYIRFINASGTTIDYQTLVPRDVADLDYVKNMGSVDFKVGFAYYISNQVAVGLEPSFLYFTQSIFKEDHPTYVVPWSVGVNFNVRMRLY